jgi:hypothetical protein
MPTHRLLSQRPPPDQAALPGDVRAEGRALQTEVARTEPTVEEMSDVLAQEHPPGWAEDGERVPKRLADV